MTEAFRNHGRRFLPLALGLGVMVMAAQSGDDGMKAYAGGPVRCKIEVEQSGNGVELQGVVYASKAVRGSYELVVTKSAGGSRSNIAQAGEFDASPDTPTRLGIVQLGGDSGSYSAKLKVKWDGDEVECHKSAGGWL
jgi:hypothetical protein